MNQKDNWIENVIKAEDSVETIQPSAALISRLKAIPSQAKDTYDMVPKKVVWAVAASVAVLIFMNVFSVNNYEPKNAESVSKTESSDSYFSYLKQI